MIKIQLGARIDPMEKMLLNLLADWDELERFAIRNGYCKEKCDAIRAEKEKMMGMIAGLREG